MKKRNIIILIVSISVGIALLIGLISLFNAIKPKTFSTAKIACEKFLDKNQTQMEEIAIVSLNSEKDNSGHYKEYYYSCYQEEGFVKFEIDAQGMLGGQYWDLVYTQDGIFYGETESYLYEETDGNNIIRAEKISEHWWYLWTDYDGTERSYQ